MKETVCLVLTGTSLKNASQLTEVTKSALQRYVKKFNEAEEPKF